jgi:hypothetical protein
MAVRLFGAERLARPQENGRPSAGPGGYFNLKARHSCRFAADIAIGDRRHNRLLQLAVAGSPLLRIDRAGWPSSRAVWHKPIN